MGLVIFFREIQCPGVYRSFCFLTRRPRWHLHDLASASDGIDPLAERLRRRLAIQPEEKPEVLRVFGCVLLRRLCARNDRSRVALDRRSFEVNDLSPSPSSPPNPTAPSTSESSKSRARISPAKVFDLTKKFLRFLFALPVYFVFSKLSLYKIALQQRPIKKLKSSQRHTKTTPP
jgi:hypothetical protein